MPLDRLLIARTKIVATLGPASESADVIRQLVRAGVDVFRLNFSHGEWKWHTAVVERIRAVTAELECEVGILQDLGGPKIRLGDLPDGKLITAEGETYRFVQDPTGKPHDLSLTYSHLIDDFTEGQTILLADGAVAMRVVKKGSDYAEAEVTLPGELRSRQGVNLPGANLNLASLTEKDLHDLDWTATHAIDFVGMSFVRRPEDVAALRRELDRRKSAAQIIAKIEKPEALTCLDGIIARSDGIMVARGDLGVEIDVARVPVVQKDIIHRCHQLGVPVITATQMLESMRSSNRPTRAEATDVANAILDGTDAVMLSAETASGSYPVAAVETMNRIARETEAAQLSWDVIRRQARPLVMRARAAGSATADVTHKVVIAAGELADQIGARFIVAATHGGHTALGLAKLRLRTSVLGLSDQPETVRRMSLYWGVIPMSLAEPRVPTEYLSKLGEWIVRERLATTGDRIVVVFGNHWADGEYNALLVHQV